MLIVLRQVSGEGHDREVGRAAEEVVIGDITTGAGNDIERATDIARRMVCEWGMSELGPLSFGKREEQIFLGREIAQHRDYSEETAIRIDEQVKKLVQGGYDTAAGVLSKHSDALVKIADSYRAGAGAVAWRWLVTLGSIALGVAAFFYYLRQGLLPWLTR